MISQANNYSLVVTNLAVLRGERMLFKQLNLALKNGDVLYLQGENGAGKTTLLRALCGLTQPYAGGVSWCGEDIKSMAEEYSKNILYIGHLPGIKEDLTALENLQFSLAQSGLTVDQSKVVEVLDTLGLAKVLHLPTRMLSQGQKRRVVLARLWLQDLSLWILDEPFTALDAVATDLVKQRIENFANAGGMVVMTSHQDFSLNVPHFMQLKLDA
ncbi:MAG TPA: cytochrome c biogenesis heme-transporting ATPase CcmA [Methylotenera sp.]|jgi:heme exporter protein A|nr:cytochrome c biogenesis heme-transporting ATPase CcmA [Methylotenera sp.]